MTITTLSKSELFKMYRVSHTTFKKWCIEGNLFTEEYYNSIRIFKPNQVKQIINHFGEPESEF